MTDSTSTTSPAEATTQADAGTAGTGQGGITAPVPVERVDREAAAEYCATELPKDPISEAMTNMASHLEAEIRKPS